MLHPVLNEEALIIAIGKPFIECIAFRYLIGGVLRNHDIDRPGWIVVDFKKGQSFDLQNHPPCWLFTVQEAPGRIPPQILLIDDSTGAQGSGHEGLLNGRMYGLPLTLMKIITLVIDGPGGIFDKKIIL